MQHRRNERTYTRMRAPWGPSLSAMPWALLFVFSCGAAIATGAVPAHTDTSEVPRHSSDRIQGIVNDFRARLELTHSVRVSLVPVNERVVSVESVDGLGREFLLSFEDDFLDALTEDELKAAIAHELGHVWIFTHHPYLQTEALANQIARRIVPRESLVRVYEKVWKILGTKGDLVRFLGE